MVAKLKGFMYIAYYSFCLYVPKLVICTQATLMSWRIILRKCENVAGNNM